MKTSHAAVLRRIKLLYTSERPPADRKKPRPKSEAEPEPVAGTPDVFDDPPKRKTEKAEKPSKRRKRTEADSK